MLPKIWFIDTYSLLIFIGVIACFLLFWIYKNKYKINEKYTYDIFILACISIGVGIGFAVLFQLLFDAINGEIRGSAMTFYGGLVGGIITFLIGHWTVIRKHYPDIKIVPTLFPIAPACITVAHAFGRLGCFMAGCCYGKQTDSFLGVTFPGMTHPVLPTQLFEAIFLFILTAVMFTLALKKKYLHNLSIYLFSYGVFRFLIEYLRGDDRGAFFLNLSPSQFFSIIAITSSILISTILITKKEKNKEK